MYEHYHIIKEEHQHECHQAAVVTHKVAAPDNDQCRQESDY